MVADLNLVTSNIKAMFYKNWYQKTSTSIETVLYITKTSAIKEYLMVCTDFDSLVSCSQIFIIWKLRNYISDLDWGLLDAIMEQLVKFQKEKWVSQSD